MGRRANPLRAAARAAGEKFYDDAEPCMICGETLRYTVNGACATCAKAAGSDRYRNLTDEQLAAVKARDHARYQARLTNRESNG